ncbi:MAG: TolC family protein [Spirosomataceae bacterium]
MGSRTLPHIVRLVRFGVMVIALVISRLGEVSAQDSSQVFSYQQFYQLVLQQHPVVKQAQLLPQDAQAELLQARGGFDPKLGVTFDRKAFKGADYYNRFDAAFKIPLWIGELKAGYERNDGQKLLSEESPSLIYSGLTIPIGQGLLIDARRNTLKQAQLFTKIAQAEQIKLINKTVYYAAKDYWEWYFAYRQYQHFKTGYDLAKQRFEATRRRSQLGELAAIDSVEAKITLQDRQVMLQQAEVELTNTRLVLSTYLWDDQARPREIPESYTPAYDRLEKVGEETLQRLLEVAKQSHPELLKLDLKLKQLAIEERFRKEMLKPQVDLNFNWLNEPKAFQADALSNAFLTNNHKLGISLSQPLFLRKERGKLSQVRLKQQDTQYQRQQTNREVANAVQTAYNEVKALEKQLVIQQEANQNQELLLKAEQRKFDIGESSVFLINSRESKLIDMRVKLESLRAKYEKAIANLVYSAGMSSL